MNKITIISLLLLFFSSCKKEVQERIIYKVESKSPFTVSYLENGATINQDVRTDKTFLTIDSVCVEKYFGNCVQFDTLYVWEKTFMRDEGTDLYLKAIPTLDNIIDIKGFVNDLYLYSDYGYKSSGGAEIKADAKSIDKFFK